MVVLSCNETSVEGIVTLRETAESNAVKSGYVVVVGEHGDVYNRISQTLTNDGYRVVDGRSPADEREPGSGRRVATIVLNTGDTDRDALDWCERLRAQGFGDRVLMVSDRSSVSMRVAALDAGADDFLANPFAPSELCARIRALARRGTLGRCRELQLGNVHLSFALPRALVGEREVRLTPQEWSILQLLASRLGSVTSRADIIDRLGSGDSTLEGLVARMRRKLGAEIIRTVRGCGYAIRTDDAPETSRTACSGGQFYPLQRVNGTLTGSAERASADQ